MATDDPAAPGAADLAEGERLVAAALSTWGRGVARYDDPAHALLVVWLVNHAQALIAAARRADVAEAEAARLTRERDEARSALSAIREGDPDVD